MHVECVDSRCGRATWWLTVADELAGAGRRDRLRAGQGVGGEGSRPRRAVQGAAGERGEVGGALARGRAPLRLVGVTTAALRHGGDDDAVATDGGTRAPNTRPQQASSRISLIVAVLQRQF